MTSIVFPGQGSQSVGMVKDFHDNFKNAKLIFEEIEDYTKIDIRKIIFENHEDKLNLTQYTQICIFASSYVIFKIICDEKGILNKKINIMMGHSLGEYTALACSNKIDLKDCCLILKKRGELMNNAVSPKETTMAALIGKDSISVQKIIDDNDLNLEIANDNSNIQIVISGDVQEIENSRELFLKNGIKKFVTLNVSAAFHSKYMIKAQEELALEIENLIFKENQIKIISNYDANIYDDTLSIKKNLQNQMANRVNWTQSIKKLEEIGENKIIEIGPNKVLSGLIKRISNKFDIISFNQISDLN
tara:strand:- start:1078 stop:1989 length:912 start_codon:yes stop_codon:yes gene_type:complete